MYTEGTILEKDRFTRAVVDSDDGRVIAAQRVEVAETGTTVKDPFEVPQSERDQWRPVGRMVGRKK